MDPEPAISDPTALLAVDVGLRTGLAGFHSNGKLLWYCSRHFGSAAALRKRVHSLLNEHPNIKTIALEGGGPLAEIWAKESAGNQITVLRIPAETWRAALFNNAQQRNGKKAKQSAAPLARKIIQESGAAKPTSLRHDAAEAILIGHFATTKLCKG